MGRLYPNEVREFFEDEGLEPGPEPGDHVNGTSRRLAHQYLDGVDWSSQAETARGLRVFERVLRHLKVPHEDRDEAVLLLDADGYQVDEHGRIRRKALADIPEDALRSLEDPEVIWSHLRRINRAVEDGAEDAPLAVGQAKELIESTLRLALTRLGGTFDRNTHMDKLIADTHQALEDRGALAPVGRGRNAAHRVLGGLTQVALAVNDLRNALGTGHGRVKVVDLPLVTARLAVRTATAYCSAILEALPPPSDLSAQ
ncbi:MAG: abortive infection family protein [Egibacteraceae bacterium]